MRRAATIILAAATLAGAVACGDDDTYRKGVGDPSRPAALADYSDHYSGLDFDTTYDIALQVLADQNRAFTRRELDELLSEVGPLLCAELDMGTSLEDLALVMLGAAGPGYSELIGSLTAASILVYCPEYEAHMDAVVERWGG